ncbi:hypothetical protein EYF80_025389 [Liparis tanakae]|uniref:Uncharacterized protein n=1 Tax=Liparis tanakae TaxID=230148 RepID=A0A4Z2HF27_9TELE|nr:hypothetical protein EYF80_025389 [Liparis tanakae]
MEDLEAEHKIKEDDELPRADLYGLITICPSSFGVPGYCGDLICASRLSPPGSLGMRLHYAQPPRLFHHLFGGEYDERTNQRQLSSV